MSANNLSVPNSRSVVIASDEDEHLQPDLGAGLDDDSPTSMQRTPRRKDSASTKPATWLSRNKNGAVDDLPEEQEELSSRGDDDDDGSDGGGRRSLSRHTSSRTSGSSGGRSSTNANYKMQDGIKCLRKVPFEIQVIVTLMVPIICLIAVCGEVVASANDEFGFVRSVVPAVRQVVELETSLMMERGALGTYLGYAVAAATNSTTLVTAANVTAARNVYAGHQQTTEQARLILEDTMRGFVDNGLFTAAAKTLNTEMMKLPLLRQMVVLRQVRGAEARQTMNGVCVAAQGILRAIIKHSNVGRSYQYIVTLLAARTFINRLSAIRDIGNQHIAVSLAAPDAEVAAEFRNAINGINEYIAVLTDFASDKSGAQIREVLEGPETAATIVVITRVFMGARVTPSEWNTQITLLIERYADIVLGVMTDELGRAPETTIVKQSLIMVFTVALTFACAAFIVFWQVRIARNMAQQQQHAAHVSRVVSSFVPKAFLRTMGTRSIMQIATGQHVNVATTMLFSDIRSFTNLSERMSNERLFSWLQQYFALMTRVTDRHSGTIDKLIGDAIFSFFPVPANGVRCAIDMQSVVVFLNSTLPSEHLVQLGVGLHHGVVAFGVFGDESRRTCTMVSSEVNLASRLEGLTKKYGVRIIVSDEVLQQVDCENFTHDVLNPMALAEPGQPHAHSAAAAAPASASSPPQQPMAARLRAINAAYARTTSRDGDGDGGAGRDQRDDADSDAVSHAGLAHRVLGEVAVKGSRRVVRIFEVFQADAVEVRKYKAKSRALFEEAVYLQLAGSGAEQQQRRRSAVLKEHAQEYNALRHRDSEVEEEASSVSYESAQNLSIGADYQVDAFHPNAVSKSQQQQQQPAQQAGCELPEFTASINTVVRSKSIPAGWKPQPPPCDACMELGKNGGVLKCAFHQNVTKMLSLLDECEAIANNLGVEDPVLAVKRAQFQRGGLDIFASK